MGLWACHAAEMRPAALNPSCFSANKLLGPQCYPAAPF
jgi:hypothetical protein